MTRIETFNREANLHALPVQGRFLLESFKGFAEILDSVGPEETLDPALTDVYMCITLRNGSTVQLTNQIVDLDLKRNVVRVVTDDRVNGIAPKATKIFNLEDVCSLESLDVIDYARKRAEQEAHELDMIDQGVTEQEVVAETTDADNAKTDEVEVKTGKTK